MRNKSKRTGKWSRCSEFVVVHGNQKVSKQLLRVWGLQAEVGRDLKVKNRARGAVDSSGTLEPKATRPLQSCYKTLGSKVEVGWGNLCANATSNNMTTTARARSADAAWATTLCNTVSQTLTSRG